MASAPRYSGDLVSTVRHGDGHYKFPRYFEYRGQYHNGRRNGHGTLLFGPDGRDGFLEGVWSHGELEGVCTRAWADGREFRGTMSGGQMNGRGTLSRHGVVEYEGNFKDNRKDGDGEEVETASDGGVKGRFKGSWRRNRRHGQGCWEGTDGTVIRGLWDDGVQRGSAVIEREGERGGLRWQSTFDGHADDCVPSGHGTLTIRGAGKSSDHPVASGGSAVPPAAEPEEAATAGSAGSEEAATADASAGSAGLEEAATADASAGSAGSEEAATADASAGSAGPAWSYTGEWRHGEPVWICRRLSVLCGPWVPEAATRAKAAEEEAAAAAPAKKGKASKKKSAKDEDSEARRPDLMALPEGSTLGGGWERAGAPAPAAAPLPDVDSRADDWTHDDEVSAALLAAALAGARHSVASAVAKDPFAARAEPVVFVSAGEALPDLHVVGVGYQEEDRDAALAELEAGSAASVDTATAAVAEAEAALGGKKRPKPKKGYEHGVVNAPSPLQSGLLPWERVASGDSGRTIVARAQRVPGGEPVKIAVGGEHVDQAVVETEAGAAMLTGLALVDGSATGRYELVLTDMSATSWNGQQAQQAIIAIELV